jgi:hypothetical protein
MRFLLAFVVMLLLGTLGVYYGIQPLWRVIGWPIPPPAPAENTSPELKPLSVPGPATPGKRPAPPPAGEPRRAPAPQPPPSGEPLAGTPEAGTDTPPATTEAPVAPAPNIPAITPPPSTPGSKGWGMTITRAAYYSLAGELRGHLAGGTVMDIDDSRTTEKDVEMALGQVERNGTMAGPYLVAHADLVRFEAPRSEVPATSLATLKQYFQLKEHLEQRLTELKKQAISAHPNPHAAAYGDAVQKYNAFGERQTRLTALRDKASGADRMKHIDTLRGMMAEGKQLELKLQNAKSQYNQWKAAHPNEAPPDLTAKDQQVQELRQQIDALEPAVKAITR